MSTRIASDLAKIQTRNLIKANLATVPPCLVMMVMTIMNIYRQWLSTLNGKDDKATDYIMGEIVTRN
jgi:hypothetical protein